MKDLACHFQMILLVPCLLRLNRETVKTVKNIIVGVVYRAPNSDANAFNDLLQNCIAKIASENKPSYTVGDFNFDLLK